MFSKTFSVLALLAALALTGSPVEAQAPRRPSASRPSVAVTGEESTFARLWSLMSHLGRPEMALKEGMSIDPNGSHQSGVATAPAKTDEGMSIDPDGRR
jgi:hypothetical protein